jgi:hypothetical protein
MSTPWSDPIPLEDTPETDAIIVEQIREAIKNINRLLRVAADHGLIVQIKDNGMRPKAFAVVAYKEL